MSYPNKTVELKLEFPIMVNGNETNTLTVRRPTLRDNMIADKKETTTDKEICMITHLTGLDEDDLYNLDMSDFDALTEVVVGFRKKSKSESETSSGE
ncbi:phage tail assembly protein [Marinomonas atlantica]|uniref:phage tail assembly protein n=1 Tax=Marinomonas atlantica TaxID=1806668 RepID=UPI00082D28E9|nr:phage tail assembly protein [Marinomonas atlantica]